jgi:hypothetical protein
MGYASAMEAQIQSIKLTFTMTNEQSWEIEPTHLPNKLELELSAEIIDWLRAAAQRTGRSEDELILEILDKALKSS